MELDLRQLMLLARRWWFLLVLTPIITAGAAYFVVARSQNDVTPTYLATATLLINPVQNTGRLPYSATTYGELIRTKPVLEPVVEELDLPFGPDRLRAMVFSEPVRDQREAATELLQVSVIDTDPVRAAAIANSVGRSFVDYIGEQVRQVTGPSREELDRAIASTNDQIVAAEGEIAALEAQGGAADPAVAERISVLRGTLNDLRGTLSQLLSTAMTMDLEVAAAQSQVILVDEAAIPREPVAEQGGINPVLPAGVAGLILAGALVLLLGYLDNAVKTAEAASHLAQAPVLTAVPRLARHRHRAHQLTIVTEPMSPFAESIRLLRTNLEFASAARQLRTVVISSPEPGEGKSTIVANLGAAMAQAGQQVVVIDADLRKPTQHSIFGVRNERGLSTLLTRRELPWHALTVPIDGVPGLRLLPSGPLPPNPADILTLDRLGACLDEISQAVDAVLVDTPPVLAVSDPLIVSSRVDGVILICRAEHTKIAALRAAAAAVRQGSAAVVGVVLNEQKQRTDPYGYVSSGYPQSGHRPMTPTGAPTEHAPAQQASSFRS